MSIVRVDDVGKMGVILDTPAHMLPREAWSDGRNVRFQDNKVRRISGNTSVLGTPPVSPYWALWCPLEGSFYWLYTSLTKAYAVQSTVHTEITRTAGDYAATQDKLWNGGILGGIPVINNGVDVPQYWATIDPATKLADLPNWPAGVQALVIRPFGAFLIALGITKSGVSHPHMVKWSHPADPGSVPVSWDETDPTKDAGEFELSEGPSGIILDGLTFGNDFIVYKENSSHALQFVGGTFIFRSRLLPLGSGIMATNCVCEVPKKPLHFLMVGDDLVVHDGRAMRSVLDKKMRNFLVNTLDPTTFNRSFCVPDYGRQECWFCYPEIGEAVPSLAIVWNSVDDTLTIREISGTQWITVGALPSSADRTWDSVTDTWDSLTGVWRSEQPSGVIRDLVGCNYVTGKLQQYDVGNDFDGTPYTSFVERTGLALSVDRLGKARTDFTSRKLVRRIWPKISGAPVEVRVGAQEKEGGVVTWSSPKTFTPGTDTYIDPDPTPNGRLLAVRFESIGGGTWELEGYEMDIAVLGEL